MRSAGERAVVSDASGALARAREGVLRHADGFPGVWTWAAEDLRTGARAAAGDDGWFPTASAAKLPIHSALALAVSRGRVAWEEPVTVAREAAVGGSGVLACLSMPLTLPLEDLAALMLVVSDNTATNAVIDRIGLEAIDAAFSEFGLADGLVVRRKIQDGPVIGEDVFARARAETLLRYLRLLADGRLPGAERTLRTARAQQHRSQMPRLLPLDGDGPDALLVANKPGSDSGTRADFGLVEGMGRRFAFVMMVRDCADRGFAYDHPAERLIGECCRVTFDALGEGRQVLRPRAGPPRPRR